MRGSPIPISRVTPEQHPALQGAVLGTLVGCDAHLQPLVCFPGAPRPELPARIAGYDPDFARPLIHITGRSVLLLFEDGDLLRPLIVGLVRETLPQAPVSEAPRAAMPAGLDALPVNGRSLVFDAQEEIVFRCGQGSIIVRADGSIVIKGTRLLSRASEVNKIRGASVQIN
jgi:hypothetical protein